MSGRKDTIQVIVPWEFLSPKEALDRSPYETTTTFNKYLGHLFHEPPAGSDRGGGYLATELEAEISGWPVKSKNPDDKAKEQKQ